MFTEPTGSAVDTAQSTQIPETGRPLSEDPRSDPRMVAALAPFGLDSVAPPPPLTRRSPREDLLALAHASEGQFEAMFEALTVGLPAVKDVSREVRTVTSPGGHQIDIHIHRPTAGAGPLPAVVHLHGGGMVVTDARGPLPTRWRDELAATGLVVLGVEFRNGGGRLGPHRFPAGLDDCCEAVRWAHENAAELGITGIVVSGESGGANLALAVALRAKRDDWLDAVSGVYVQCPYIHGQWSSADGTGFPSTQLNNGVFMNIGFIDVLSEIYDPGAANASDPTCWPLSAGPEDVRGLPPHVISVNEVDPLRDEGIAYHRMLLQAGVTSSARMNMGVCHIAESLFRAAIPELGDSIIHDVHRFAQSVTAS